MFLSSRPAFTKCQRNTESADAQPTQEPVLPWSLIVHQGSRRSLLAGIAARGAASPTDKAVSKVQSFSCFGEGRQFRMRLTLLPLPAVFFRRGTAFFFAAITTLPLG